MSATTSRVGAGLLAALLALAAQAQDIVKVGVLLPFSGVYGGLGKDIDDALELGFDTFGREVQGVKIELVKADTETKPNLALAHAKKLILQDQVQILAGIVASNEAAAIRDYVHNSQTPLIIANAGNNEITGAQCSPWIVRSSFSNHQITSVMGPWMYAKGYRNVFLMAFDYAAGHQMMDAFRATFTAAGGKIAGEEYPPLEETKDFGPYLAKLQAANPDAAFVFFAGGPAVKFVKEYEGFGLKGKIPLAGAGWLTSPLYLDKEGSAAEGILNSLNYVPAIDSPENQAFQKAFQEKYHRVGSEFGVQGYDSARLIVEAVKIAKSKGDLGKPALRDALRQVTFMGPRGPFRIDPKTHNIVQSIYIYEIKKQGEKLGAVVLDVIPNVQDEPNGCQL